MNAKILALSALLLVPALAQAQRGERRGPPPGEEETELREEDGGRWEKRERRRGGPPDMDEDGEERGRGRRGPGRRGGPGMRGGPEMEAHRTEMREHMEKARAIQKRVREKARALREGGKDGKNESIRKELEKDLGELFDLKLAAHEKQLKRMQEHIAKLKEQIEKRRARKAEMVKKRLAQLAGEDDDFDW